MKKKGQGLNMQLGMTLVIALIIMTVALSLGGDVTQVIRDDQCSEAGGCTNDSTTSQSSNITDQTQQGLLRFGDQLPTIGTVVGVILVLSLVIGLLFLVNRFR